MVDEGEDLPAGASANEQVPRLTTDWLNAARQALSLEEDKIFADLGMTKEEAEKVALEMQVVQRGRAGRRAAAGMNIEADRGVGLTRNPEEEAQIAKLQAIQLGNYRARDHECSPRYVFTMR
jgi:hypothetical protein